MDLNRTTSEILGIPFTEDPRLILGVTTGRTDHIAINNALRRRLAQLHVHPSGHSEEAGKVREYLQSIAKQLLLESSEVFSSSDSVPNELTPLDQAIIAALVCEGGWNKKSRARLVGVAASYSITVGGLMRIMEAFSDAARSGRGSISTKLKSAHTIDRSWANIPKKKSTFSVVDSFLSDAAKKFTPELSSPNPVMTIKLAVLFSILTLLAFILSLQVLLTDEHITQEDLTQTQTSYPASKTQQPINQDVALFAIFPTFKVDGIEQSMLSFADKGVDQPKQLATIASSIRDSLLKGEEPTSSILQEWNQSIDVLAIGWPFMDTKILHSAEKQLFDVLLQAEMDVAFVQKLLQSLQSPSIKLGVPSSLARATWSAGILARLSCDQRLGTTVRSIANKAQLSAITTCDSNEARKQVLQIFANDLLLRTEFDSRSLDMWEAWIIIAQQLQNSSQVPEQQIQLVKSILQSDIDLFRDSNTRNVLGRIVNSTDWTSSPMTRDSICEVISSEEYSSVDIAMLTEIFNSSDSNSWFDERFVVNQNDSINTRDEIATRLLKHWPVDRSNTPAVWTLAIPTGFDIDIVEKWIAQVNKILHQSTINAQAFAKLRMLNEAAISIWKGRPDLALHAMDKSEIFSIDSSNYFKTSRQEVDGTFSDLYHNAGKDEFEQLEAIDSLLNDEHTDLGPRDATLLATIAIANSKYRLRMEASRVIVEQFPNGPNVALALLNNFHKAKTKEQISSLVAGLTDSILPDQDALDWKMSARKAFVQHSLTAGNRFLWEFDEASSAISSSLLSEYLLLNPEHLPINSEIAPLDAIEMVVQSWLRAIPPAFQTSNQIAFSPTGVLQFYLLKQLEYYSLLKAEESRWRSEQNPIHSMHSLTDRLHDNSTIFEQLTVIETEISLHWLQLFSEVTAEYERRATK